MAIDNFMRCNSCSVIRIKIKITLWESEHCYMSSSRTRSILLSRNALLYRKIHLKNSCEWNRVIISFTELITETGTVIVNISPAEVIVKNEGNRTEDELPNKMRNLIGYLLRRVKICYLTNGTRLRIDYRNSNGIQLSLCAVLWRYWTSPKKTPETRAIKQHPVVPRWLCKRFICTLTTCMNAKL